MVVAFYFRLHLAYFPRPVVAIFARTEQSVVLPSVMPEILLVQAESELALQSAMANGLQFSLVQFQTQP